MCTWFEMIRTQRNKPLEIWIEHDVTTEVNQFDEEPFPRGKPEVGANGGYYGSGEGDNGALAETIGEERMEFFPVFWEVECSPATGDLREERGDGVYV